jgi:hypothetical protein
MWSTLEAHGSEHETNVEVDIVVPTGIRLSWRRALCSINMKGEHMKSQGSPEIVSLCEGRSERDLAEFVRSARVSDPTPKKEKSSPAVDHPFLGISHGWKIGNMLVSPAK